jgi:magnesium-transporting ATPase (P-type)
MDLSSPVIIAERQYVDGHKDCFVSPSLLPVSVYLLLSSTMSSHPTPDLTESQEELLQKLQTDLTAGLTTDEASLRREQDGYNVLTPPVNCPAWICCLLPCIKSIPSMKAFRKLKPDDAEVLRNSRWVRYDAASIVRGDIIRLEEGDIVPADAVVLSTTDVHHGMLVDVRGITGESKPRSIVLKDDTTNDCCKIYYGGLVLHGGGTAVVTAVGSDTLLADLIQKGKFPPKGNVLLKSSDHVRNNDDEEEAGISLISSSRKNDNNVV